jgi:hypothetical protein
VFVVMVSVRMPAMCAEVPEGPPSVDGLGQVPACSGENLPGRRGVVDGARQHQGAGETGQDGHRLAAVRDAAPVRHVLAEEPQQGLEPQRQSPARCGRLARQLASERGECAAALRSVAMGGG